MSLRPFYCASFVASLLGCAETKAPTPPQRAADRPVAPTATATVVTPVTAASFPTGPIAGECAGPRCFETANGFRYLHPLPVGMTLESVVAVGRNEALIVGDHATVLRVKGDVITRVTIPDLRTPATTWAEIDPATDIFTAFPGSSFWQNRLEGVVRTGPRELLVLVDAKSVARFDGTRWSTEKPPLGADFGDTMFGDASSGAVVVPSIMSSLWTSSKPILRIGDAWTRGGELPPKLPIRCGVARGKTVWLGGDNGKIVRSEASGAFEAEPLSPPSTQDVTALWIARDGKRGLAVTRANEAYERESDGWHAVDPIADGNDRGDVETFWSTPDDGETWAVGDRILRRRGNGAWRKMTVPAWAEGPKGLHLFEGDRFHAVDGTAADDVWIVGRFGAIFHYDGAALREISRRHLDQDIVSIQPLSGNTWLAFGTDGTVLRGDGVGEVVKDGQIERGLGSVVRTADGKIVVVNHANDILVRDDTGWSTRPPIKGLYTAHGAQSERAFYSVGWDGRAERITPDGKTKVVQGVKEDLRTIAFAGPKDAWIIGDGIILRGDGTRFSVLARHPHDDYRAISIRAPDDVWIAGDARDIGSAGLVLHWDGKKLHRYEKIHNASFRAIHASPRGTVWAVGHGAAAWFDGTKWQLADVGGASLNAVWVTPEGAVVAGGDGGVIVARPTTAVR